MPSKQWAYRPSEEEHEKLMKAMREEREFTSVAQFVREGVLRLIHGEDRRKLYTELEDVIERMKEDKDKFMEILLRHSEEDHDAR